MICTVARSTPRARPGSGLASGAFYMGAAQFEYWRHTLRFLTRGRPFTDDEARELQTG